ncbi:protein phosphatase 1 regulatory subunit 16A-like isoform X2 [Eriocheir sinensis]|uniref:protein phosphatase 1 regulatory subunit 16A-like isoform X2 n=1 Tax=Eriocheir sinensis TaxID=95602 RepID=UPI0021CA799A|nr:protein phosphatase 1 regulatory subunit 16A-like isoform X2 [Eriocheir sinensis]
MEHSELIAEMAYIEKLSTQERLKLARRRRMQQMKKWSQKEREVTGSKREKTALNEAQKRRRENKKNVLFVSSVMLLEAAARNDIEEVKALLEAGVDPDSTNEDGLTALHQCCIDDSEEMMRLLVQHNADVNAQDSEKWTPLHAAATCGHLHLAKFLIAKGANLLAVNADGNMPYDICEDDATLDYIEGEMASRGVTQTLIDETRSATETHMLNHLKNMKSKGQSLMFRDHQGATPLHIAAANGYVRVVEYLLGQNVPTEARDHDDWSPLHAAACWGHPDVLEMLVQNGANLHARTKNQETPYDICEDAELRDRIMQLINELETKRLHDHTRRIRRAHSNTRTQSVRRTSIREKTLTPKKEAQEEARIRLQLENKKKPLEDSPALGALRPVKEGEGSPMTSFPSVIADNSTITTVTKSSPTNKMVTTTTSSNRNSSNNNSSPATKRNSNRSPPSKTSSNRSPPSKSSSNRSSTSATSTSNRSSPTNSNTTTSAKDKFKVNEEEKELKKEQREKEKENTTVSSEEERCKAIIPTAVLPKRERDLAVRSNSITSNSSSSNSSPTKSETSLETKPNLSKDITDGPRLATPPVPPPRTSSSSRQEVISAGSNNSNGSGMVTHSGEGGSKIDIHVTVTVNPFSPGTLADLKKQRALSRASQSSYTLSPPSSTASTYSLSTSDYDSRPHPRGSEFSASSVRVDTVSYRPPASPSATPRKFCGNPSEVIGGVDAHSCCSLM